MRQKRLAQLGKTLDAVEKQRVSGENDRAIDIITQLVDNFGVLNPPTSPSINTLAWLGGKVYIQSSGGRKGRPGEHLLHAEAVIEDASRMLAIQIDKALTPEKVVDVNMKLSPPDLSDLQPEA